MPSPTELLTATYRSLSEQVTGLRPEEAWQPTGCAGWAVLDLSLHLVDDARRGLVALATPADGPATSDAVAYWRAWQPTAAQDEDVAWRTRVRASVAGGLAELSAVYAELVAAVTVLAERTAPDDLVGTQGHVLRADDLLSTLAVEAAVHPWTWSRTWTGRARRRRRSPRCGGCSRACWAARCRPGGTTRRRPGAAPAVPRWTTPTAPPWGRPRSGSRSSVDAASPQGPGPVQRLAASSRAVRRTGSFYEHWGARGPFGRQEP